MEESQRITPELVIEAYKATGLRPIKSYWITSDKCNVCALSAVILSKFPEAGCNFTSVNQSADALGLPSEYAEGFTRGFDHVEPYIATFETKEARMGIKDGTACRQAIWNELGECLI